MCKAVRVDHGERLSSSMSLCRLPMVRVIQENLLLACQIFVLEHRDFW